MNETYEMERQMQINSLRAELVYMETELDGIKESGEYKDYTALMRTYLAAQKAYLKFCAEADADADKEQDALLAFAAGGEQ